MDFTKYENKLPYPKHPSGLLLSSKDSKDPAKVREYADSLEKYLVLKAEYETKMQEYREEDSRLHQLFREDALKEVGLENHRNAHKAFSLANENGHSGGYNEVFMHLRDYAELMVD